MSSYTATFSSVVTETEFTSGSVLRVTEKTVKPFCMGHPVIVIGNPHSLRLMRDLGFQSFGGIFDEAYDDISNPVDRFDAVIQTLIRIRDMHRHAVEHLDSIREVATFNIDFARHKFAREYEATVERDCVSDIELLMYTNSFQARGTKMAKEAINMKNEGLSFGRQFNR